MAARVLRSESPARMPFVSVQSLSYIVNLKMANTYKMQLPPAIVAKAARVIR